MMEMVNNRHKSDLKSKHRLTTKCLRSNVTFTLYVQGHNNTHFDTTQCPEYVYQFSAEHSIAGTTSQLLNFCTKVIQLSCLNNAVINKMHHRPRHCLT